MYRVVAGLVVLAATPSADRLIGHLLFAVARFLALVMGGIVVTAFGVVLTVQALR